MKFNNGKISTEDLLRAVQRFDIEVRQLSRPDWLRVVAFLLNDEDAPPPYRLVCAVAHTFGAGATATLHLESEDNDE